MNDECIFCKIINNEIPSFKIYEDEMFCVILDRFPATKGHALIIPKQHADDIFELPDETAAALYPLAKKLATKIKASVGAEGINIVQNNGEEAGQSVKHFHLHIIPRWKDDKVTINKSTNMDTTIEELNEVFELIKNS